jgi:hypothetical protein
LYIKNNGGRLLLVQMGLSENQNGLCMGVCSCPFGVIQRIEIANTIIRFAHR